jgi:hypothetical protein
MPNLRRIFADGPIGDLVTEIVQSTGNTIVAPAGVFARHPDTNSLTSRPGGTPRRASLLGAVELLSDQSPVPGQDRIGLRCAGDMLESLTTESLADFCQCGALRIGQSEPSRRMSHEALLPELLQRHSGTRIRFSSDIQSSFNDAEIAFITVGTPPARRMAMPTFPMCGRASFRLRATRLSWRRARFPPAVLRRSNGPRS